ncbi:MAG: zinc dependent phospholipase C family protein [Bacteroidota bacterium]
MKKIFLVSLMLFAFCHSAFCWGFFAHQKINYYAVFLLPPEMMALYKPNINFLSQHAVDPDKRRYVSSAEGPHHFIDIDHYGKYPFTNLPRKWKDAVEKFSEDSLRTYGIVPWWIQTMEKRLTEAFKEKNQSKILRYSAEIGHYIADAHVPLHTSANHNGQLTGQQGIHGFWESRIPELLADKEWDFFIGKATYISNPEDFIWKRILESAAEADSVLSFEKELSKKFSKDQQFAFEEKNGKLIKQYSYRYTIAYNKKLNNMVERRMQQSIYAVACFWYTAWVNAGQPDLKNLSNKNFSEKESKEFEELDKQWKNTAIKGREED